MLHCWGYFIDGFTSILMTCWYMKPYSDTVHFETGLISLVLLGTMFYPCRAEQYISLIISIDIIIFYIFYYNFS